MLNLENDGKYFPFIDYNQENPYHPKPIVYERTKELANLREYELGYWMQYFIHFYQPYLYPRVCNAFGYVSCWYELRYLMEHATYDPEHPLYNLDYETLATSERREDIENLYRLEIFIDLAKLYAWYPFVKRDRPNLLPIKERKPLTRKEQSLLRWMPLIYSSNATTRINNAWNKHFKFKLSEMYPKHTTSEEDMAQWNEFQEYLNEEARRKKREARWEKKRLGLIQKKQKK